MVWGDQSTANNTHTVVDRFRDDVSLPIEAETTSGVPSTSNIFDNLPVFRSAPDSRVDELTCYLSTGPGAISNEELMKWWYECCHVYPNLARMALNYRTILCMFLLLYSDV
jgi:hypothetical protein